MPFPNLVPTARSFDAGDYPVKSFNAQSGKEIRILYGSRRTGAQLSLSYANVTDANANLFFTHYEETKGTYATFDLATNTSAGSGGIAPGTANKWRYSGPPEITNVKPGISTVTVKLQAVL